MCNYYCLNEFCLQLFTVYNPNIIFHLRATLECYDCSNKHRFKKKEAANKRKSFEKISNSKFIVTFIGSFGGE